MTGPKPTPNPTDEYLIACFLGGDEAALRTLIDRYDRLVRYTIFRCTKDRCLADPFWLDTVASNAWLGFVQALRRDDADRPRQVSSFVMTIAHRQAISALRGSVRAKSKDPGLTLDDVAENQALTEAGPGALLDDLEQLDTLRKLVNDLPEDERLLFTELDAIINRRWVDAAASLGLSESTVRSKWKRVLEHLRGAFGG